MVTYSVGIMFHSFLITVRKQQFLLELLFLRGLQHIIFWFQIKIIIISLTHYSISGPLIDANDFVIRFNAAPTHGYESDVGSKTSLRIINSQVVANPSFKFLDESHLSPVQLFSKSPVLVWDPSGYNSSLDDWYGGGADFPFFQVLLNNPGGAY